MAYESLYRRYRPQRFSEVRGQDHVVGALHNAVRENRVGHAYLLSGPRGTGKTSTARILAKALNCTNLDDGEPCGECDSCVAIEAGTSYDLMELDAASNNGVDAMRDLIAKASLGSPGRTKVYLLDEVHMLSTGASNALLKTLEEPPGHVVFVLATTDPHKVLPTIRSRTQHFELHLLPADELRALVDAVIADAGLDLDADAIDYALRVGGGSARDTLSALDQVVAAGGVLDRGDQVDALVDALAATDTGAALREVADAVHRGHDPRVVGEALLARVRDVFLFRMGAPLSHTAERDRVQIESWAEQLGDRACTRVLELVGDALREMRTAPDARIPLEVALVRLTRQEADNSLEGLTTRVERLERGAPATASTSHPSSADTGAETPSEESAPAAAPPAQSSTKSRGSGRPGDAARAALAGNRSSGSGPRRPPTDAAPARREAAASPEAPTGPPPVPSRNPQPAPRAPVSESPTDPQEPAPQVPASGPEPAPQPAPKAPASDPPAVAPDPTGDTGGLSTGDLEALWTEKVLSRLSGLTKAMFSVGHFVDASDSHATFAVPNDVHRTKSAQKLGEVEAALAEQLGRPMKLELVVEGHTRGGSAPTTPAAHSRGPSDEAADIGPVDELEDAPDDDRSATQRIVETFPGAEIVDT